jgi:hypothetical protein
MQSHRYLLLCLLWHQRLLYTALSFEPPTLTLILTAFNHDTSLSRLCSLDLSLFYLILFQLIKVKEHHPERSAEFRKAMLSIGHPSSGSSSGDGHLIEGGGLNDNDDDRTMSVIDGGVDNGEVDIGKGQSSSHALCVTEATTAAAATAQQGGEMVATAATSAAAATAYDGSEEGADLFGGQHPPPGPCRAVEELLAFSRGLLDPDSSHPTSSTSASGAISGGGGGAVCVSPSSGLVADLRLVSGASMLVGGERAAQQQQQQQQQQQAQQEAGASVLVDVVDSDAGELPSMFSAGESTLETADRLRGMAEALLHSLEDEDNSDSESSESSDSDQKNDKEKRNEEEQQQQQLEVTRRSALSACAEKSLSEYERALASSAALCRPHVAFGQVSM